MNQDNREFWAREVPRLPRRMADEALRQIIFLMQYDEEVRLPGYFQKSLHALSNDAEKFKCLILAQQGRKGGKQRKPDALQRAIIQIVRRHPTVTVKQLEASLTRDRFPGLIVDIVDGYIHFIEPDGSDEGRLKEAKISALKHRLSRAKRSLRSP